MDTLPYDVLRYILQFIPYEGQNWLSVVLTCNYMRDVSSRYFRERLAKANSQIYVLGGSNDESSLNSIEKYDSR
jgi:hypothetical protein